MEPRLTMRDVGKSFGSVRVLDAVDLQVEAGEIHAIVGENGAGKSTLMKILSGAYLPDRGEMQIDGRRYEPRHPHDGRAHGIAMIYQELSLAPHLSVMENISLGNEPSWGPLLRRRAMQDLAESALARIGRQDLDVHARVAALSLADRQQIEIARSVVSGCRILVLDEPTSSLTSRDIEPLFRLLRQLKQTGLAIVYISHFLEEVQRICDRFTVLRDGRRVGGGPVAGTPAEQIVGLMVGRQLEQLYPRSPRQRGECLLAVNQLSNPLLLSASLELHRGEVLGIAGLVGAGRTELMRAIFGLDSIQSGEVRVGAFRVHDPHRMWRHRVGLVSEDRKLEGLALNLSIADNITLPWLKQLGPWQLVYPARQNAAARRWIESLPIKCDSADQRVNDLSGGNQQKVALARLLHADVDVFLLDEPTRGIDVGSKSQVYQLIDRLVTGTPAERPRSVLLVSSYLPELLGICDRIAVMSRGHLGPARPASAWTEHSIMQAAIGAEPGGTEPPGLAKANGINSNGDRSDVC